MKALLISDIHGNLPALNAVLNFVGNYDYLIFTGDIVDYGPFPVECVDFIKSNANFYVRGNHDNALAFDVDCKSMGSFREFAIKTREWHKTLINEGQKQFLGQMPLTKDFELDGKKFRLAHASPKGDLFKYLVKDDVLNEIEGIDTDFIVVGHTHFQFIQTLEDGRTVVNPGSVGLARDGGSACFAIYENGKVKLHRIKYDFNRTIKALYKAPLPESVKKGLAEVIVGKGIK